MTTDFGLDILTVEMPNVLHAFLDWIAGAPFETIHTKVRLGERVLSRAIRISGWSHCYGNIAKGAAHTWILWPEN